MSEYDVMEKIRQLTKKYPDVNWFCIYELYGIGGLYDFEKSLENNNIDDDK